MLFNVDIEEKLVLLILIEKYIGQFFWIVAETSKYFSES